jgi:hypothetical protein
MKTNLQKTTTLAALFAVAGCGLSSSGGVAGDDATEGALAAVDYSDPALDPWQDLPDDPEQRDWILMRRAIDLGHGVGQEVYVASINVELARADLAVRYEAGEVAEPAADDSSAECPYHQTMANDGSSSVSCRYLAERARDESYVRAVTELAERPLSDEFLASSDPASLEDWYEYASDFGVEGEFVRAMDTLRTEGACDTAPTALESSYEAGVATGRALMSAVVDEVVARTAQTVCDIDNGIAIPARTEALARVDATVAAHPLCPGVDLDSIDDLTRYRQAELDYARGVDQGVREQFPLESEELFRTWICTPPQFGGGGGGGGGDPLVLDLDGDGVRTEPMTAGPLFAFGAAGMVRTAWSEPGDAFVVLDRDGDGRIVSSELFGDVTATEDGFAARDGFEALALYDSRARGGNDDGHVDATDSVFAALGAWNDVDGDAHVDAGELRSLASAGVSRIDLDARSFERTDGSTGTASDLWLEYAAE